MQVGLQASLVGRQWLALQKETQTFNSGILCVWALFGAGKQNLTVISICKMFSGSFAERSILYLGIMS